MIDFNSMPYEEKHKKVLDEIHLLKTEIQKIKTVLANPPAYKIGDEVDGKVLFDFEVKYNSYHQKPSYFYTWFNKKTGEKTVEMQHTYNSF